MSGGRFSYVDNRLTVNECRSELYKTFGVFEKEKETEGD